MKYLIDCGCSINVISASTKFTPLLEAAKGNQTECIKLLLNYGANIQSKAADKTILEYAIQYENLELIQLIVDRSARLIWDFVSNGSDYLAYTVEMMGKIGVSEELRTAFLLFIDEPKIFPSNYEQAFLIATSHKFTYLTERMLSINPHLVNSDTLLSACYSGNMEATLILIKDFGIDINAKGKNNDTALTAAARGGHLDIVKYLINETPTADIKHKNSFNSNAVMCAATAKNNKSLGIIKLLLYMEPDLLYERNKFGDTALHQACFNLNDIVAQYIIDTVPEEKKEMIIF